MLLGNLGGFYLNSVDKFCVSSQLLPDFILFSEREKCHLWFFAAILEIPPFPPAFVGLLHFIACPSVSLLEHMNCLFVDGVRDLPLSRLNLVSLQNMNGLPSFFCCAVHNSENRHVNRCVFPPLLVQSGPQNNCTRILRELFPTFISVINRDLVNIHTYIFYVKILRCKKTDGYSVYYFSE